MPSQAHPQKQVAAFPAAHARFSLAGQPDALTFVNAARDFDLVIFHFVRAGASQRNCSRRSVQRFFERDHDVRFHIAAALSGRLASAESTERRSSPAAAEKCLEEIAEAGAAEFKFNAASVYVEGDPARLQQVFWNLIKNSVKFTPANGRITIATSNPKQDEIQIRVTDTGIGIDQDKIDKIFNAFEQGQSSITRRFGGLGLGLAISKAMVDAHRGKIRVESPGKDRGSTFIVDLKTVPAPVGAGNGADGQLVTREKADAPARKRRVLVVDDHADTCTGMKMMLERRGYDISVAHSAEQAIKKAEQEEFDLLISDIGLPDRSGYELMRELRESKGLQGIALSGFGMENDVSKARDAGFSEHLTKPINFERLEAAIRDLLESKS